MGKYFKPGGHDMRNYLIVLVILWAIYVVITFLAPAAESTSRYGLTLAQVNFLRFTILLPQLFIWATLLFSIVRFRRYYSHINGAPEAEGFRKITLGLWMLFVVATLPAFITGLSNYWPHSPVVMQFATIIRNYTTVVFYLMGFWYLWHGSRDFYHTVASGLPSNKYRYPLIIGVLLLGVVFAFTVFQNSYRTISDDALIRPTYYLPDPIIVATIIVPYVITWLIGSLTILNLLAYTEKVQGKIYRQTFSSFAYGLIVTITLLIGLQFLSQANAALNHATLKIILVIIYVLFLAIAVGYLLIARGARKLTAIEEVQ